LDNDMMRGVGRAVAMLVPMILSLSVHEFAHAWVAKRLGDDTAEKQGRLTLNPLPHVDPIGTVLLPLAIMVAGGGAMGFFGWARPVPVNAGRFSRRINVRTGMMLVAAAGPLSNLVLAFAAGGLLSLSGHMGLPLAPPLTELLQLMIGVNVGLFVFNLIPIHPLDGQKVLSGLLSAPAAIRFERFNYQFGWMTLLFVVIVARDALAVPIVLVTSGVLNAVGLG
jgi:Zn-dependent protease